MNTVRKLAFPAKDPVNDKEWWGTAVPEDIERIGRLGADMNAVDGYGWTLLDWAATYSDNPRVIEALVRLGADTRVTDRAGATPLHKAAAWNDNPEIVKALINLGMDINARDQWGATPLHRARDKANHSYRNGYVKGSPVMDILILCGGYAKRTLH